MKNIILSLIVVGMAMLTASSAVAGPSPSPKGVRAHGAVRVVYRMYGGQKKLVNSRALASSYTRYLTSLGAQTKMVQLGSRYLITYSMRGSKAKSFTTRKAAGYFQSRLRSLGFHATILGR